jgi:hypothetical protein
MALTGKHGLITQKREPFERNAHFSLRKWEIQRWKTGKYV